MSGTAAAAATEPLINGEQRTTTTAATRDATAPIKQGWLLRQSTYLKRWKKAWFVLYSSGRLAYFDSDSASAAQGHLHIPAEMATILSGETCHVTPPDGHSAKLLLALKTHLKTWHLCAENEDDHLAWKMSLEEARSMQPTTYGQQQGWAPGTIPEGMRAVYPQQVNAAMQWGVYDPKMAPTIVNGSPGAIQLPPGSYMYLTPDGVVVVDAQGHQTIFVQGPGGYRCGSGDAMLAGAAIGSMMMWPWLLWMPLFWW